jgi:hypothetical protein
MMVETHLKQRLVNTAVGKMRNSKLDLKHHWKQMFAEQGCPAHDSK